MKKFLIAALTAGVLLTFTGCGEKNNTEAYDNYIRMAKEEILNENYNEADKYLTLAQDEKTKDKTATTMKEQLDLYVDLISVQNTTNNDYIEELQERVKEMRKKDGTSEFLMNKINLASDELAQAVDNGKKQDEVIETINEKMDTYVNNINNYIENKQFDEAVNENGLFENDLMIIDNLTTEAEKEPYYPYVDYVKSVTRFLDAKDKADLQIIPENYLMNLDSALADLDQQRGNETIVVSFFFEPDYYHVITQAENGNYKEYIKNLNASGDKQWAFAQENKSLVNILRLKQPK
jgi:hypothetical protein